MKNLTQLSLCFVSRRAAWLCFCGVLGVCTASPAFAQDVLTASTSENEIRSGRTYAARPRLFVLAVGAGDFNDPAVRVLPVSTRDADDVATALKAQTKGGLYTSVVSRSVTGKAATRKGVRDGLQWLKGNVGSGDVTVIFVSGHKIVDSELNARLLTADVKTSSVGMMRATSLSVEEIQTAAQDLPGKTLLRTNFGYTFCNATATHYHFTIGNSRSVSPVYRHCLGVSGVRYGNW